MNIIDLKLIDAWTVKCLYVDDGEKSIDDIMAEVVVPDKYKREVGNKVANRRIEVLSE